ncbi:hypothetical protein AQUCO_02200265v1 [Aquilegia coerulea]|uniref:Uncharacterized protein n=1 Tax=Aquilegia coerulea TaxID=218851 RepID=A0A2G5DDW9_AQUCA|nr:hypothetical protein AQUCO_02200265v1 [Aquilegia coerulea]
MLLCRFPFIACEIFTCEVDIILKTLVEDEELMHLLFSFLEPNHSHITLLAGYFSKVVICLMLRKTVPFMNYVQAHQEIFRQMVDLIGITSIMEVLIRLIGADEHIYTNYMDAMQWLEDTEVLEMIVDKLSSSDCPEVHANAAETLCAITRYAPPGISAKISSPSFIGRLFRHALEDSRPRSVLIHSLSVCISLLDPKRSSSSPYHMYRGQLTGGPSISANPEMVEGMLESLGDLLKLLDTSSAENILETTYGKLQPPLGKHRLKIVEFISILLAIGSEAAEKELIRLGAIQRILDLFFEYTFNNFLHHHVENIVVSCLESKKPVLIDHLLSDCKLVDKLLTAEKQSILATDTHKPTVPTEGRSPPRIGNIGHITRISNKLVNLGNNIADIQAYLQENTEWAEWHTNVLLKRNAVENVYQWACGRPTALHDRNRDSDDDDFRDRDYDVAALANNLSQAFRYGIYSNDDNEEGHGALERDDEDVYFDDESAEVVISSLRLGDEQDSGSLFTNSNWFAFDDESMANERSSNSLTSPSPNAEETAVISSNNDDVVVGEDDDLVDTATSSQEPELSPNTNDPGSGGLESDVPKELEEVAPSPVEGEKPPEWVQWRETSNSSDPSDADQQLDLPNGELASDLKDQTADPDISEPSSSADVAVDSGDPESSNCNPSKPGDEKASSSPAADEDTETVESVDTDKTAELKKEVAKDETGN